MHTVLMLVPVIVPAEWSVAANGTVASCKAAVDDSLGMGLRLGLVRTGGMIGFDHLGIGDG